MFVPAADLRVCVEKEQLNFFPRTLSCLISFARNLIPRYFFDNFKPSTQVDHRSRKDSVSSCQCFETCFPVNTETPAGQIFVLKECYTQILNVFTGNFLWRMCLLITHVQTQ